MVDSDEKPNALIKEIDSLRQRIADLEHCEGERKVAEEVLRNERNRFRTLSESAPFGIIMIDKEGVFEYINPKSKELFGYDLDEVPNSLEWFRKAFPDPKARGESSQNASRHL